MWLLVGMVTWKPPDEMYYVYHSYSVEGGIHWKSTNPTHSPKKPIGQRVLEGRSPKPIRVKVLTNREGKSKVSASNSTPCGQCDKSSASLVSTVLIVCSCHSEVSLYLLSPLVELC